MSGMSRCGWPCLVVFFVASCALGARIRPDGDPAPQRVIWADPFDNYSQWAWDNRDNPAYQPNGTIWEGGPVPAGSPTGTYPYKSDNGDPTNPYNGCGVTEQSSPAKHLLGRQQWISNNCGNLQTPAGFVATPCTFYAGLDKFRSGTNCTRGGWVETIGEFGRVDAVWQHESGYYTSLAIFSHDLTPRIQSWSPLRSWDQPLPDAVQGTDEHPLTLVFYLHDSGTAANPRAFLNNTYVELNLDDEHAPTDYIWRGRRDKSYDTGEPECCPEGPYPIVCQQVREVNAGNHEQQADLDYLNAHCPSLVPPYDPQSGAGKTWQTIAFGFLAIGDKDPCKCQEQGIAAHLPQMNHPMLFDGNVWRELRNGRGNALNECPPSWGTGDPAMAGPETMMQDAGGGACGNFELGGGTHRVYLKLTTDKILIWMHNDKGDFCGAFDRVYKGPFNGVSIGVGPGCELQDKAVEGDAYACKPGGTPKRCLTYASSMSGGANPGYTDGYWRTNIDAMNLLDGVLVQSSSVGACCRPDGTCELMTQADCVSLGGVYRGSSTVCGGSICAGACCQAMNACSETNYGACSGTFRGLGTHCSDAAGCPCVAPWPDYDWDGDIDQEDFAAFQRCASGPGLAYRPGCRCFDRDDATGVEGGDGDVDAEDFTWFRACASGPDVPFELGNPPPGCIP